MFESDASSIFYLICATCNSKIDIDAISFKTLQQTSNNHCMHSSTPQIFVKVEKKAAMYCYQPSQTVLIPAKLSLPAHFYPSLGMLSSKVNLRLPKITLHS